jgi:hypothetical protein
MPIIIASLFISPWRKAKNEMQDIPGKCLITEEFISKATHPHPSPLPLGEGT